MRSAVSSARVGPVTVASTSPRATRSPSRDLQLELDGTAAGTAGQLEDRGGHGQPGHHARRRGPPGRPCRSGRPGSWPRWSRRRPSGPRSSASAVSTIRAHRRPGRARRPAAPCRGRSQRSRAVASHGPGRAPPVGSSATSRWPQPLVAAVREVLAPVAAPGLLARRTRRRPARAPRSAGWSPPSSRSAAAPGPRPARPASAAVAGQRRRAAQHPGAPGHRPLQRRRGPPAATTQPVRRPASAPARPAPAGRAAMSVGDPPGEDQPLQQRVARPAGWRRARRCRRPRRRRTGPGCEVRPCRSVRTPPEA